MGNTQYTIHQAARLGLVDTIRSQLEQDSRLVDSFDEVGRFNPVGADSLGKLHCVALRLSIWPRRSC
jgi:hypothetical protein